MTRLGDIPYTLRTGPFRSADALAAGLSYKQLLGTRFRRIFDDVYVTADTEVTLELRCRAAAMRQGTPVVFCGITAARLYGLPTPDRDDRIHIGVPPATAVLTQCRGIAVHRMAVSREETRSRHGLPLLTPERLLLHLASLLERTDLVITGDATLRKGLASTDSLAKLVGANRGRRGVRRLADALPLFEQRTDSPMETRLRLIIVDAGLPRPLANADVFDEAGQWIARPDLLYPRARIAIEYDGGHHRTDQRQFNNDLMRGDLLAEQGYLLLRYGSHHVFRQPHRIVDGVQLALQRRADGG